MSEPGPNPEQKAKPEQKKKKIIPRDFAGKLVELPEAPTPPTPSRIKPLPPICDDGLSSPPLDGGSGGLPLLPMAALSDAKGDGGWRQLCSCSVADSTLAALAPAADQ